LGNLTFPVNLSAKDKTRTINPQTSGYFDLMTVEIVRGGRKVTLADESGATCTFEDDLFKMLSLFYNGYTLTLVVSSSDFQKVEKTLPARKVWVFLDRSEGESPITLKDWPT
jgi:hypothetical protein